MWLFAESNGLGLDTIIQLASAGGFGTLAWYLIAKIMPEKEQDHRKEREQDEERHRRERREDQERWLEERAELRNYLANRDAKWLEYTEKRDDQIEQQQKQWLEMMIRLEAMILKHKDNSKADGQ